MPDNFGPVPGGSTILWQTEKHIAYRDSKGQCWRYMHEYDRRWPLEFVPGTNPVVKPLDPIAELI